MYISRIRDHVTHERIALNFGYHSLVSVLVAPPPLKRLNHTRPIVLPSDVFFSALFANPQALKPRIDISSSPTLHSPSSRKQGILLPQILTHIRLSKRHHPGGIQLPRLRRTPRTNPKPQRRIIHTQHHHSLMLGTVLAPPSHMRFQHVAAVQEWHLAVGLDPYFVARVRGDDGQGCDV